MTYTVTLFSQSSHFHAEGGSISFVFLGAMTADDTTSMLCRSQRHGSLHPKTLGSLVRSSRSPDPNLAIVERVLQAGRDDRTGMADLPRLANLRWPVFVKEDASVVAVETRTEPHPFGSKLGAHQTRSTIAVGTVMSTECATPSTSFTKRPDGRSSWMTSFVRLRPVTVAFSPRRYCVPQ